MWSAIAHSLWAGRSGDRNPMGAKFSALVQTVPGANPAPYNGYSVFPRSKAAGAWRLLPALSRDKVKERVELYIYSPSGLSWAILE